MKAWSGVWVAMATPFKNGSLDLASVKTFTRHLIQNGVHGLCPAGTTGEGSSLNDTEFKQLITAVLEEAKGKVLVVPGTGSNNTLKTIERTKLAEILGADGALVVTPCYVKPTPDGLVRHYGEVSKNSKLPLMLYNVPGRTAVNMMPDTVEKVMDAANVKGVKECASMNQLQDLIHRVGNKVSVFSGEDPVFVPALSVGVKGIVSVAANVIPEVWTEIFERWNGGEAQDARVIFLKHAKFVETLFIESNPIPLKFLLEKLGIFSADCRSPLAPLTAKNAEVLISESQKIGLSV